MNTDKAEFIARQPRRRFLKSGTATLLAAVAGGASNTALANRARGGHVPLVKKVEASEPQGEVAALESMMNRRLHLVNSHTGDNVDVVYYTHGIFMNDNISKLNNLMRDRRANTATQMDTTLYDQLFLLRTLLDTDKPVHVLSGYRTPETNAKLRRRSKGVAKYSLHMEGRAADIYIPGIPIKTVQKTMLEMQAGGVGVYSKSNFVHIDTGQVRHWGS